MGFGSDFGLDTLFDVGAVAAAPLTGGASLAASPTLSGFASDALMGALGDLGSAAIGGGLSFLGQSSANQYNAQAAREQMAFQERMRDTQYQAAVKDLRAAGLNPMMAYGNIHTASPSGALGVGAQNALAGVGQAISNVKPSEIAKRGAEVSNLREQNQLLQATTAREVATARMNDQSAKTGYAQELVNLGQLGVQQSQIKASNAAAARDIAQAASLYDQRAKDSALAPLYNLIEGATQFVKDKVQSLSGAHIGRKIPNYTIIGNPK